MSDNLNFRPQSILAVELNPASVIMFNVQARNDVTDVLLAQASYTPDPSGHTSLPIGLANGLVSQVGAGNSFRLYLQEVGPAGDTTEFRLVNDADNNNVFIAREIPNGTESAIVVN